MNLKIGFLRNRKVTNMLAGFKSEHWNDENDNPAGGVAFGNGFTVSWQNGPLGQIGSPDRKEPNGAFVEDIIQVVIDRLNFYQDSKFSSEYNKRAIEHLKDAARSLDKRTKDREAAGTEGTHKV